MAAHLAYQSTLQQTRSSALLSPSANTPAAQARKARAVADFEADVAVAKAARRNDTNDTNEEQEAERERGRGSRSSGATAEQSTGEKVAHAIAGGQFSHGTRTAGDDWRGVKAWVRGKVKAGGSRSRSVGDGKEGEVVRVREEEEEEEEKGKE
ncbi:uncharacterized protein K452DRAFT_284670 [Aplosporella prunicola CBS 121167]|uniref:Uncharacterized protein n=1 Tax=Aplosporella prunicola CBS 121167 TaxID=1176127 RepID=A0A6A6BRT9_9PEZI|nr:uncharacterized protein K452DRAFT_284670 [Aplosporella prunicola CBS 121167]KAF2145291.1 hypothetical protein K452DRAFT_284670 [Aplosporella prunicola CBS 121167]